MLLFLSFIIIALVVIMARFKTLKTLRIPRKKGRNLKKNRLSKKERFVAHNNNTLITDEQLQKCNNVLVDNNKKCNCFKDDNYEFSDKDIIGCISKNDKSECSEYNKCRIMFENLMTGSEPDYDPDSWSNPIVEGSHNCYTYFLNDKVPRTKNKCRELCMKKNKCKSKIKECGNLKPQPGKYAAEKTTFKGNRRYTCPDMVQKVILDNTDLETKKPIISKTHFAVRCPHNHYKGALVVDPNNTYHFYRQDSNGQWSHKQGTLRVENKDASGQPIFAPHLSDNNYNKKKKKDGINYTDFCNYMCIPSNGHLDTHAI